MLRANDLNHDPVLARRINRLQEDKAREAEQSDAEDEREVSVSQPSMASVQPRIKNSSSPRRQVPPIQEVAKSSMVDDLGSSDDEDEEACVRVDVREGSLR